jgi:hypothetical protein
VESPVSRLTIEIIERIFLFAHWQCVCLEGSGKEGMIPGSPQASLDGFQASTYFAGARHDFVFKTGCHGVGYYLDLTARKIAADSPGWSKLVRITYAKSLESDIAVHMEQRSPSNDRSPSAPTGTNRPRSSAMLSVYLRLCRRWTC